MAKYRTSSTALSKTLERTDALVYIVGDDRSIQYANPACSTWAGVELESMFGVRLVYSSDELPGSAENKLKGLCPPGEVFDDAFLDDDQAVEFYLSTESGESDHKSYWRRAHAFRIADREDEDFSILVVSTSDDLLELPAEGLPHQDAIRLHAELAAIRQQSKMSYRLDALVGNSSFAHRLRRAARIAAEGRADALILGPAGSGKEHLARTIHATGKDALKTDIVPVQCSVADQQLIQAVIQELLKKRKHDSRPDKNLPPDVLLLLDVDRLSRAAQSELWGFLRLPKFPLRVIATTTRDLRLLADAGEFETELAHGLGTLTIELLPICERSEDIALLAQAILEKRNSKRDKQLAGFDPAATQLLVEFHWPGNLDQLSGVIRESAALAHASLLTPEDLPKKFHDALLAQRIGSPVEETIELDLYLETIERELLTRALQQAKGNKTKAAKLLTLNRAKFLRRLQYFALDSDSTFTTAAEIESPDFVEPGAFEETE